MRLTASRLAISKNSAVVPAKHGLDERKRALIEDLALGRFNSVYAVVSELADLTVAILSFQQSHRAVLAVSLHAHR